MESAETSAGSLDEGLAARSQVALALGGGISSVSNLYWGNQKEENELRDLGTWRAGLFIAFQTW
jgi:hypothetical protein